MVNKRIIRNAFLQQENSASKSKHDFGEHDTRMCYVDYNTGVHQRGPRRRSNKKTLTMARRYADNTRRTQQSHGSRRRKMRQKPPSPVHTMHIKTLAKTR